MCDLLCMWQWQNFNATKIPMCLNVSQVNKTRKLSLSFFTLTLVTDIMLPLPLMQKVKKRIFTPKDWFLPLKYGIQWPIGRTDMHTSFQDLLPLIRQQAKISFSRSDNKTVLEPASFPITRGRPLISLSVGCNGPKREKLKGWRHWNISRTQDCLRGEGHLAMLIYPGYLSIMASMWSKYFFNSHAHSFICTEILVIFIM